MISPHSILLMAILTAVCGQLLLKTGMNLLGPLDFSLKNILFLIPSIFRSTYLLIGLFFYGLSALFWLFALSKLKLSLAYPATSLMYVFIILASWLIFRESINGYQIAGIAVILFGLFLLFFKAA